jgi:hypothetical protein
MVNIWDLRKISSSRSRGQTIAQFHSQQPPSTSSAHAIRSVQFASHNSVDLLLAVEQSTCVNVIDCQYYEGTVQTSHKNFHFPTNLQVFHSRSTNCKISQFWKRPSKF